MCTSVKNRYCTKKKQTNEKTKRNQKESGQIQRVPEEHERDAQRVTKAHACKQTKTIHHTQQAEM